MFRQIGVNMTARTRFASRTNVIVGMCGLALVVTATGCGNQADAGASAAPSTSAAIPIPSDRLNVYQNHAVTFGYPKVWGEVATDAAASSGDFVWSQGFGTGEDHDNVAVVTEYAINQNVTPENISSISEPVETSFNQTVEQLQGTVTQPITPEATAGLPGYTGQFTSKSPSGVNLNSALWIFFKGKTEFTLLCQSVPAQTETMSHGCAVIRQTFRVTS